MKQLIKGIKKGFQNFGENISVITNSVLLSLVYLIGIGITAAYAKLRHKEFMDMKLSKEKSYWSELNLKKKPTKEYYRQF